MSDERLTDEQLAAIAAADEKRTPGVWRVHPASFGNGHWSDILADVGSIEGLVLGEIQNHEHIDSTKFRLGDANAAFIAVASWAIPALVDEVRRLRAERDALALRVDEMHRDMQQGSDAF